MVIPVTQHEIEMNRVVQNCTVRFSTKLNNKEYAILLHLSFNLEGQVQRLMITDRNNKDFQFNSNNYTDTLDKWTIVNMLMKEAIEYARELNVSEVMLKSLKWNSNIHM